MGDLTREFVCVDYSAKVKILGEAKHETQKLIWETSTEQFIVTLLCL